MKHCPKCNTDKEESDFYKNASSTSGLQSICKVCTLKTQKAKRILNPRQHREWSQKSYYKNHAKNLESRNKNRAKWIKENPVAASLIKTRSKLAKYGLTIAEYDKMAVAQNHKCGICGVPQSEIGYALAVDHSHETGKVRGLLCIKCNVGIGNLNDSVDTLLKAIDYLKAND